jgi:hypothetical protein
MPAGVAAAGAAGVGDAVAGYHRADPGTTSGRFGRSCGRSRGGVICPCDASDRSIASWWCASDLAAGR